MSHIQGIDHICRVKSFLSIKIDFEVESVWGKRSVSRMPLNCFRGADRSLFRIKTHDGWR